MNLTTGKLALVNFKCPSEAPHPKAPSSKRKIKLDLSETTTTSPKTSVRDHPIVARAMSNSPQVKVSDEDLEKYSHLSEQAGSFMVEEEEMKVIEL